MYPNIPIDDGIAQIASILKAPLMEFNTLEEAAQLNFNSRKELIILLLRLVLKFNYVAFADKTYRQVIGTAMGTACAPPYANLFLALYEESALAEFRDKILLYKRFIDDIFSIVHGSRDDVENFKSRFGALHPNMKMEWSVSRLQLPFLDVLVSLEINPGVPASNPQFRLVTSVYQKALNAYLYIPWNSCHSLDSKRAWVKGELIRYVQICSKESDFANIRRDFLVRLRERGYPGRWLEGIFEEIRYKVERPTALKPNTADTDIEDPALHVLKLTHNPIWDDIDLNPFWRELAETWTELEAGYPEFRFMASFKKPTALGDRLNTTNRDTLSTYHASIATTV
jgi:hypothetical protein